MKLRDRDTPANILIVDDEPQIVRVLRTALTTQGHVVHTAADGVQALEVLRTWSPHLIITDLAMPQMNGVDLTREIRLLSEVPIIVLSVRNHERMKIEALDAGADDFVTKPFSIQELQARVRAQLRRNMKDPAKQEPVISAGDFVIDRLQHRVIVRGEDVHLPPKQFDLLVCFAEHAGQVMSHRALLHAVWGTNAAQPEYLRVNIGQLRKKIETTEEPRYILTEPWVGYRFRPTGDDE